MLVELTILGANSALPSKGRFPSSQVLSINHELFIIDCGEGTQIKFSEYRFKPSRVVAVCISHMHGDHLYGLPGLLSSFSLAGRQDQLFLIGPKNLKNYIDSIIEFSSVHLTFPLIFIDSETDQLKSVLKYKNLDLQSFPMKHRIPTFGFKFSISKERGNLRSDLLKQFNLTIEEIKGLLQGIAVRRDGKDISHTHFFQDIPKTKSYCYCSDTVYDEELLRFLQGCDLLYHEATYLHELQDLAEKRYHSTAKEAAMIAQKASVDKLVIGHYSSRYDDLQPLLDEAKQTFDNTFLAIEGVKFEI